MPDSSFSFTSEVRPICELGVSDAREAEPDSWLDISCHVHQAEIFRGRERFNDRFQPATASISFDNRTGWADVAGYWEAVAAVALRPGRQLRIGMVGSGGETRWLFYGWVDRTKPTYDPVLHDIVVADCIDALGEAGIPVAPAGPLVGANETVDARINRVLDSVGWFPTKRIVAASATTVTATNLGGRAIDHMSQAADSAGGVVHGDLNGNVVFKDLNWELYDPDDPPDGTIGNVDPDTPGIPGDPAIINPDPGYVYDPDPLPITERTVVTVCADGTEGTLVQQGDQFKIFARDGRLLFSSSGHTWDLGDFEGGCVGVAFDPDAGEVVRWDDPDEDGVWDESIEDPIELLPQMPIIDLLAYSQGSVADGLQSTVTVGPITPGNDCMLFLLVNAVNGTPGSTSMRPLGTGGSVTGGGFDWTGTPADTQSWNHELPYPGSLAFLTYVVVGREDPGTFSVTIDWLGATQSKCHIAALYRARGAASDLYDRLEEGYRAPHLVQGNTPGTGSGNGPVSYTLFDEFAPLPIQLRTLDATIAQSLAESTTAPFGATFGGAGDWTIDPLATDISRTVSWNSGWRTNTLSPEVTWSDVNLGAENIQSCQVIVNVEPTYALLFAWKIVAWRIAAPAGGTIASGVNSIGLNADDGSMLVVFVSVTADHDMASAITCTHPDMTFTVAHVQPKTGSSWGQGAVFTGIVPDGVGGIDFDNVVVGWVGHTIQTRSVVIYEVTNPGDVGVVGSGVLGTETAGSVDGSSFITVPAAPAATSVVLASLHVRCDQSTAEGAHPGGDDYVEELEDNPDVRAYIHSQSRGPGTASSTDPNIEWNDVHTGTANTYSGVQLAVEITAGPDFVMFSESDQQLVVGGLTDPFLGPIFEAQRREGMDPNIGDLIWSLLPSDVTVP